MGWYLRAAAVAHKAAATHPNPDIFDTVTLLNNLNKKAERASWQVGDQHESLHAPGHHSI